MARKDHAVLVLLALLSLMLVPKSFGFPSPDPEEDEEDEYGKMYTFLNFGLSVYLSGSSQSALNVE
jgi:hypothetical protein